MYAKRKILGGNRIRVKFRETAFMLFGNKAKRGKAKGTGVWKYVFSSLVNVEWKKHYPHHFHLGLLESPAFWTIAPIGTAVQLR